MHAWHGTGPGPGPTGSFEVAAIDAKGQMRFVGDGRDDSDIDCGFGIFTLETLSDDDGHFGFRCVPDPDEEEKADPGEWKIPWSRYDGACK